MTIGGRGIYVMVVKSGARRSYVSTTGEKINAGKVLRTFGTIVETRHGASLHK
ncbi:hypothetical protein MC7420_1757 [Coleofasciculus chthonoplastes PCC 7420]|uniref:Uncharacterized protein n=1 Tax=Coleofasciculus chthonoplastes PCC 7420 TaxID=118168 RepID=B4VMP0_9CYAN|nr:hypothetical protein [Coleofasciculus chthonoplastes]EDX76754.1 hypothetical protein MC7420_1757 [Coleofasciculus chthonoplastes PCC 7420]